MKIRKKLIYTILFLFMFITFGTVKSNAGDLYLNNLDFKAQINTDGSMDVTETWNIDVEDTNTLYKTFETDNSKYSNITNVTVKEITDNQDKKFLKTNDWAYHVQKGYYYGTNNQDGDFEIGWGVGLDDSSASKKYEISYTVENVISKYSDYAELYWQFVGKKFEVNAKKITGTIILPSNVSSKDDIKVWGHTEDLNGTIYATDLNKIEFEIDNFRNGRYVEVRTLFPTNLITSSGKTKNINILQTVIDEETKWAEEANARRKREQLIGNIIEIGIIIANIVLVIFFIIKAIKYLKEMKNYKKYKPSTKLEYYRDLPDEKATPGEAVFLLNNNFNEFIITDYGKVFSATLLDLTLKGFTEIRQDETEKDKVKIKVIEKNTENLKSDEVQIYNFIKNIPSKDEEITIKDIQKAISKSETKTKKLIEDTHSNVKEQLINSGDFDNAVKEQIYDKYMNKFIYYLVAGIFIIMFSGFTLLIAGIACIIDCILCKKIIDRVNVLTQKGIDEQEEWKGLKKYMVNFSMLDKREVPELVIWEKYLVFATAFGVADKVIKQLKLVYPNMDEMLDLNTYAYMNLMMNTNFSNSFSTAINSSISTVYSSSSGGGGGFSGGGGFGRRWPEAADGR